ncbi:MAG: hypothetical protein ABI142_06230 [Bryocella sp.]
MLSDWSAECAHDAPTLVVPWKDPSGSTQFYDLRAEPFDIAEIREAELYPVLGRALRALNASRSPFLTAKCDVWILTPTDPEQADTLDSLRLELNLDPALAHFGFASYIDLLFRERIVFASRHYHQDRLDRIVRRAQKLPHDSAALELVLRPALLDLTTPLEGFAITVYLTGIGPDEESAFYAWSNALEDIVHLLRSRDLEPGRTSATIDTAATLSR